MIYISGQLGEQIAHEDKIVRQTIQNIIEKENHILNEYSILKNFSENASSCFRHELDKQLEEKKLYLAYKMQSKTYQTNALLKLLEYTNALEAKDKQLQSQAILDKLKFLEESIIPYKTVLM